MYIGRIVKSVFIPHSYYEILEINGNLIRSKPLGRYEENKFICGVSSLETLASRHYFEPCTKIEEHNIKLIMAENS